MIYLNAFIFCGFVCLIGQIILEETKLTPGHLNTILVVLGCILAASGLYNKFILWAGAGATIPITNFGNLLVTGSLQGYYSEGFIGLLKGLLVNASAGLSATIIISFIVAIIFKSKN